MNKGTLYIVATPIGNLEDITLRAISILKSVDLIACEDTRVSRKLLDHFGISKEQISLHQHSGDEKMLEIIERLQRGQSIAYISDGGTPGISDPGQELAARIRNRNINIIPIPGPSALTAAVSISGLVEKEFYFAGFLPKKKGRQTKFIEFSKLDAPIVIYESALRLEKTLKDFETYLGADTEVFIAREMTKMFEEYWGGEVNDVINTLGDHKLKGEITLVIKRQNF